jgi:hypothetical protein
MSQDMVVALIGAVAGVAGSSGLWAFVQKRSVAHTAHTRALMGLLYDKILQRGMSYIDRGYITKDEFEEFLKYLVEPYKDMGGNGVADKVASQVGSLPFRTVRVDPIITKRKDTRDADE